MKGVMKWRKKEDVNEIELSCMTEEVFEDIKELEGELVCERCKRKLDWISAMHYRIHIMDMKNFKQGWLCRMCAAFIFGNYYEWEQQ